MFDKLHTKKGFTLVELVVVIAILAILAAVVVPMITGYISSATSSAEESDASVLNDACKTFFVGVAAGTVTADDVDTSYDGTALPSDSDTLTEKRNIANTLTVYDAAVYSGLKDMCDDLTDFGIINAGKSSAQIVYMGTNSGATALNSTGTDLLSDIYGSV